MSKIDNYAIKHSARYSMTLGVMVVLALSSGCSTSSKHRAAVPSESAAPPVLTQEIIETDAVLSEVDPAALDAAPPAIASIPLKARAAIPVEINESVQRWIEYFTTRDRERFQRFLNRGHAYREVVEDILDDNGLPAELYYLAMIESGYVTSATSVAKAKGVWQFIRATGKRYGLHADGYVDERKDPIRATEAAAKYLKDLHEMFGSWYLAMAAYNAGERRIQRAIQKMGTKDFWVLAARRALPRETTEYVPKFLAATIVGRDPKRFGLEEPVAEKYPDVDAIEVPSPIRLSSISKVIQVSEEKLKFVNPHLSHGITPAGRKTYEVWIPDTEVQRAKSKVSELAQFRMKSFQPSRELARLASADEDTSRFHRVRSGETLSGIAKRYRLSVSYLKRINGFQGELKAGQTLRVTAGGYHRRPYHAYRVKSGDRLDTIAKKFGVTVQKIKRINRLRHDRILAGQTLKITTGNI